MMSLNNGSSPAFTWTIDRIGEKLERSAFQIESPTFPWKDYPVLARARLDANQDGDLRVSMDLLHLLPGHHLRFRVFPRVSYLVKDGSGRNGHLIRHSSYPLGSVCANVSAYEQFLINKSRLVDSVYVVDGSLSVEIHVETPAEAARAFSCDGSLEVRFPQYRQMKRLEREGCVVLHDCPYIYTGPCGYRVQVQLHPTGGGKQREKAVGATVSFLTGFFDDYLPLDYPHRTVLSVYNALRRERCLTTVVERNIRPRAEYSMFVCGDQQVEEILGADEDLCFRLTIEPLIGQEMTVERVTVESVTEESATEESVTEESVTEESGTEERVTEENETDDEEIVVD